MSYSLYNLEMAKDEIQSLAPPGVYNAETVTLLVVLGLLGLGFLLWWSGQHGRISSQRKLAQEFAPEKNDSDET